MNLERPLFPDLEDLQCFGFDYDAKEAEHSSWTGKAEGRQDNTAGRIKVPALPRSRFCAVTPKLQRIQLTEPAEQDNKLLELWDN